MLRHTISHPWNRRLPILLYLSDLKPSPISPFNSVKVSPNCLSTRDFSSSSCMEMNLWLCIKSFWIFSTDFSKSLWIHKDNTLRSGRKGKEKTSVAILSKWYGKQYNSKKVNFSFFPDYWSSSSTYSLSMR